MHIIKAVGVLFVAKDHGIGLRVHGIAFRALLPALWSHRICGRQSKSALTGIFSIGFGIAFALLMLCYTA
jgi:hypothetical protein